MQDAATSAAPSAPTESSSLEKETAIAYRPPPVLQNAGYGAAGGVQVCECICVFCYCQKEKHVRLLVACAQGLDWYTAKLKQDRDGDVADEFLLERTGQGNTNAKGLLHVSFHCASIYHSYSAVAHRHARFHDQGCIVNGSTCAMTHDAIFLQAQKRHLKPPKDPTVLVADGNVYVVPT